LRLFNGGSMVTVGAGCPFTPLVYVHGALSTAISGTATWTAIAQALTR